MRGWKNFQVRLTYASEGSPAVVSVVTIRATHRSMALFVAKRDYPRSTNQEIVEE